MIYSLILIGLTVCALVLTVRHFSQREREWREREETWRKRELHLIDQIGRANGVPKLRFEQERVVKIHDPEVSPLLNDVDMAFYLDEVLEECQHVFGVGASDPDEARVLNPIEWAQAEARVKARQAPLRVA